MSHKKARTTKEARGLQETRGDLPGCWIQWKGTDVCMDFHCKCGEMSHIDEFFAYNVRCPYCGTVFMCNGHIELIEITNPSCEDCIVTGA